MQIDFIDQNKLRRQIKSIIKSSLGPSYRVYFFGSRVKGNNLERSDIDIAIGGPQKVSASKRLDLQDQIDNLPYLYKFDIVDLNSMPKEFSQKIMINAEEF
ncbi:hypothetical protein A2982_03355 [candidate division WWE3 bacterium RIFCSPLOWO2_01_FULL_39_13]|uniref:Polymerase beta nucleotidyltransferase domain-containing protein n=1 Tax=candidate division WWE3 bacterium RIFCSPLOWO2_01_FULL_39_13 TaxID=1802624 RepID=A0A1F4V3D2_UNCKA|nr:MAG: hypothetical protein A2982_03355 [candidate division WWE3 bacterium RIFCSPLOWO2_01_FULL_39_13]